MIDRRSTPRSGTVRPARSPRRARGDRGAALFETALAFPIFFVVVVGIFELGLVFRDYLTVEDAVGDGSRIGAIQGKGTRDVGGNAVSADYSIVAAVREGMATVPVDWIDRVVVYEAAGPSAGTALEQIPDGCTTSTGSSSSLRCNVYPAEAAFLAVQDGTTGYFTCAGSYQRACGWDPSDRDDGPELNEIDYVGVYVKLDREYLTGLLGDDYTLEYAKIARLEPGEVEEP